MRTLALASLSFSLLIAGCGKSDNPGQGNDGGGDDQPAIDAGPTVLTGEVHTLTFPTVHLEPGEENTQCVVMRLPNTAAIKVHKFHNHLSQQSHHLIVYKDDDPAAVEQLTPINCQPFTGALNTTGMIAPMMITQKQDDLLELPNDVGYTFAATQMIKLEMHYINTQDTAQDANATVEFQVADPTTVHQEANILFIGSIDIDIKPNQALSVDAYFPIPAYLPLKDSKIFAITGHTHKLGTNMTVSVMANDNDPAPASVYAPTPFSWSEPETTRHDPEFSVPAGGGFKFNCSYQNTTDQEVKFGEKANDEMCFFWAYYYPSQGAKVCIHTTQFGGQDLCCPGSPFCDLVTNQF